MVGISALKPLSTSSNRTFMCTLCNQKLTLKREQKAHVIGRVHKLKSLAAAYSDRVHQFITGKMNKEGWGKTMPLINDACIALEKEEYESETTEVRKIRAYLLGKSTSWQQTK